MKILISLALFAGFASGCATSYPKIALKNEDFTGRPEHVENHVPFVEQTPKLCGPTALYMASKPFEPELTLDTVTQLSFTPGASGSYPQDMLSATRRLHLAPYSVKDLPEIFGSLAAGDPVIIFHRTGFLWKDLWHYSVLTGYDRPKAEFIMHIGPFENKHADVSQVIGSWVEGGRWAFVVEPPNKLPAFARFQEALDNDLAFLRLGFAREAYQLSLTMEERWPERYEPDVVMADALMRLAKKKEALTALKRAQTKQPTNVTLNEKVIELSKTKLSARSP